MIPAIKYKASWFYFLLGIAAILLFIHLGTTPIYILDEAKNAECAREMFQQHQWIIPTFNGELRTDKPPLHYFFMALSYKIFGVNEFSARFFSVIMGLLTLAITYFYAKRFITPLKAFCAVLVLVASTHFLFESRLAVPDPYLIFFITLGLLSGFTWLEEKNTRQLYVAAAALALACLAKGPVALALPGLCLLSWIILQKKWKSVFSIHLFLAAILFCLIALPWYFAVDKATDSAWTRGFFIDNNIDRFANPQEGHGGFFGITILFFLAGFLPYIIYIGDIFKNRKHIINDPLLKFSGIVVFLFLVFFSIASTRLPNYAMPCYPFAAIIVGKYLAGLLTGDWQVKKLPFLILILLTICIPVAAYFTLKQETGLTEMAPITFLLGIVPLLFLAMLFIKKENFYKKQVIFIFWIYSLFNLIGIAYLYPAIYQQNPVTATLPKIQAAQHIYAYKIFNPGFRFYVYENIPRTANKDVLNDWLKVPGNAVVITRVEYLPELKNLPLKEIARHRDIFELPTTVILAKNEKY